MAAAKWQPPQKKKITGKHKAQINKLEERG
jgi:hypothetical protein